MQKKQNMTMGKSKKARKHSIGQRLVAGLLCICLSLLSLPIDDYGNFVLAAEGREVVMFPALPREVRAQTVPMGVSEKELDLPETVTAVCRVAGMESLEQSDEAKLAESEYLLGSEERVVHEPEEDSVQDDGSPMDSSDVQEGMEASGEMQEETEQPEQPVEPMPPEDTKTPQLQQTETVTIEGVSWSSEPEYDSGTEGTYIFTPTLPSGYTLAEGTELPEILVTVEGSEEQEKKVQEEAVDVTSREEKNQVQEESFEAKSEQDVLRTVPSCGVISEDTVWSERGSLTDGELIIDPGVTLTINEEVTIDGTVTIKGGGMIARGVGLRDSKGYILVSAGGELILENVTLDGQSIYDNKSILYADSGSKITMNSGSIVQNCISEHGGAMATSGTVEMNAQSMIQNCSATHGGAIYNQGTVKMNAQSMIQDCSAASSAGAIYNISTVEMNENSVIQNCRAEGLGGAILSTGTVDMDSGSVIQNCNAKFSGAIANGGAFQMNSGSIIQNCSASNTGGAISCNTANSIVYLNDARIENCTSGGSGGGIYLSDGILTINGGIYKNNKTINNKDIELFVGGGFVYNAGATLIINGGKFIGNASDAKGGCIFHHGYEGTITNLNGGHFEGNTCDNETYKGSGGLYYAASTKVTNAPVTLSGSVQFCGDGVFGSGTDGVYLAAKGEVRRKIQVCDTLSYPVTLYLKAQQNYVLAEGSGDYQLLQKRDKEKIKFVDVGESGQKWYAVLDEERNQVYLSDNNLESGYFVTYFPNGAQGSVTDDNNYQIGDKALVKSSEGLVYENHVFKEWNTKQDGTGKSYLPGDELEITGDMDLFAIFKEEKSVAVNFYSSGADQKETYMVEISGPGSSGTMRTPQLRPMVDWNPVGWDDFPDSYKGNIGAGAELTVTESKDYYGVYEKQITLSYAAEGIAESELPREAKGKCYANVHEQVTKKPAEFRTAQEISRPGYIFEGWSTEADGTGELYQAGEMLEIESDLTLYAKFRSTSKRTITASFYSGGAGQKENKSVEIEQTESSGRLAAPQLKEMTGWTPVGWDESKSGYTGRIKTGAQITLTTDKDYYGVYKQNVTLSYALEGGSKVRIPSPQKKSRYANVHEQVTQISAEFTVSEGPEQDGYVFEGWNTKADGTGDTYQGGDLLRSDKDMTLYAIYKRALSANFYSGSAGKKEVKSVLLAEGVASGTITAPDLLPIEGWEAVGWDDRTDQYLGETAPGSKITLTENVNYYGIYKRDITLSYMAEGVEGIPEAQTAECRANIHDKLTVSSVEFTVAAGVTRPGYIFTGWNTKEDGTGVTYQEGESLLAETDIKLYAMYQKVLTVDFYSGKAGQKEVKKAEIADGATSAVIRTPELKELELPELRELAGWEPVGWDPSPISYQGNIAAGSEITLTEDASFYGVYQKGVTLSYEAIDVEGAPQEETLNCYVNVHEEALTFPARFLVSPAVERPGCAFVGWNTKQDGTGDTYQEGEVIEAETDLTLYAIYQKTLTADFYSGGAGRKESKSVSIGADATSGSVTAPELAELEGWEIVGWDLEEDSYMGAIPAGIQLSLTRDTSYYGVYKKNITLSYDCGGADVVLEAEQKECRANVHEEISYDKPGFILAQGPTIPGYQFDGWNTKADGTGRSFPSGSIQWFSEDRILYATWKPAEVPYTVEHYKQDLEGGGYTLAEEDTESLLGPTDTLAQAQPQIYEGFKENMLHESRYDSGRVEADGSLVLKLFYDREVYHVDFDLNGGSGESPESQSVRYGGFLQLTEDPKRAGYTFKGWYLDEAGTEDSAWDFSQTVEENTATQEVTLYAKWADETAPVLGEASFGEGHTNFLHWLIDRKDMRVTVPITEEGSGVKHAKYVLIPVEEETGKEAQKAEGLFLKVYAASGEEETEEWPEEMEEGMKKAKVYEEDGEIHAEFTVDGEFKGKVAMICTDHAGNVSIRKMLTAVDGGIILEDHAPEIQFKITRQDMEQGAASIAVQVSDQKNGVISGGIAGISYQVDGGNKVALPKTEFQERIVEKFNFIVEFQGEGKHILKVDALDNAGNKDAREMALEISMKKPAVITRTASKGGEPQTGERTRVEIYATVSMIAGFTYLLLYFKTREHGMTEEKKEELVARLVKWAKGAGGMKRLLALAAIFLLLAYYHSIGKNVSGEWREVNEK